MAVNSCKFCQVVFPYGVDKIRRVWSINTLSELLLSFLFHSAVEGKKARSALAFTNSKLAKQRPFKNNKRHWNNNHEADNIPMNHPRVEITVKCWV